MGAQIKAGALLRRGTDNLTAAQLSHLLEHPAEVAKITEDIDKRTVIYKAQEKAALEAIAKLAKVEARIETDQAKLAKDQATLESDREAADAKHKSDMEALGRRTREVMAREKAAEECDAELDARSKEIERTGLASEEEARGRLEAVAAQEAAAEERDAGLITKAREVQDEVTQLNTAAKMIAEIAARLTAARR